MFTARSPTNIPTSKMPEPNKEDDRQFEQHKPGSTRKQKKAYLLPGSSAVSIEKRGEACQKDENWRAEVRHPPREEQCRIMHVARIHRACAKKVSRMIEGHQDHYQSAEQVNAIQSRPSRHRL
jgi:hypothetical protein